MKRRPYPVRPHMAVHPGALAYYYDERDKPSAPLSGGIAVLTVDGPLEQVGGYCYQGYDQIAQVAGEALGRDEVWALVLRFRSPGGDVAGMLACAAYLRATSRAANKPLIAVADEEACSAAYCLAAACDWIVVPPTGVVGSVGVLARIGDRVGANEQDGLNIKVIGSGKYKGELHPDTPLTDDSISRVQDEVNDLAGLFAEQVATHRGGALGTAAKVLALQADTFRGSKAVEAGLADQVGSFADALEVARQRAVASRPQKTTAARPPTKRTAMKDILIRMLGLAASATDDEITSALHTKGVTLAQLAGSDSLDAVIGKLAAASNVSTKLADAQAKVDAANAKTAEVQTKLDASTASLRQIEAKAECDALTLAGDLPPSMKAVALSLHGTASWQPFLEGLKGARPTGSAPAASGSQSTVTVPAVTSAPSSAGGLPGAVTPSASAGGGARAFDETDIATLKAFGLTPEEAAKALAEDSRASRFDFTKETV